MNIKDPFNIFLLSVILFVYITTIAKKPTKEVVKTTLMWLAFLAIIAIGWSIIIGFVIGVNWLAHQPWF